MKLWFVKVASHLCVQSLRQFPFNRLAASMEKRSTTCGICLEDIQDEDMCFELCHPFHVACIRPWFFAVRPALCVILRSFALTTISDKRDI